VSDFVQFCLALGLVVDALPPVGRWVRVPTVTHPRKKNGAVKFMGTHGFVQEHSTMQEVAVWKASENSDAPAIDHAALKAATQREHTRIAEGRARAAERAQAIVAQSKQAPHAYLAAKGFPETLGLVWQREGEPVLVVPMRVDGKLCGCQLIAEDGDKKFLLGQVTRGATFVIGQGAPIYCEGYATALSANKALQASRLRGSVVVCFSAHNLQKLATAGVVLADNDESKTGERAAQATGRPYWMSPVVGEDFNDYMGRVGLFAASQALKATLAKSRRAREAPA
jgi:phage/plasmid primase-like uncharacterized protein